MKSYEGRRKRRAVIVTADGRPLDPRLDLWNHSPPGFEWGYCGCGPAQLSLAILADHLADEQEALNLYHRFKWQVIAELPYKRWTLTSLDIDLAIKRIRERDAVAAVVT
jgi:hypothetical protein